jgi:hypothetical protein
MVCHQFWCNGSIATLKMIALRHFFRVMFHSLLLVVVVSLFVFVVAYFARERDHPIANGAMGCVSFFGNFVGW